MEVLDVQGFNVSLRSSSSKHGVWDCVHHVCVCMYVCMYIYICTCVDVYVYSVCVL